MIPMSEVARKSGARASNTPRCLTGSVVARSSAPRIRAGSTLIAHWKFRTDSPAVLSQPRRSLSAKGALAVHLEGRSSRGNRDAVVAVDSLQQLEGREPVVIEELRPGQHFRSPHVGGLEDRKPIARWTRLEM